MFFLKKRKTNNDKPHGRDEASCQNNEQPSADSQNEPVPANENQPESASSPGPVGGFNESGVKNLPDAAAKQLTAKDIFSADLTASDGSEKKSNQLQGLSENQPAPGSSKVEDDLLKSIDMLLNPQIPPKKESASESADIVEDIASDDVLHNALLPALTPEPDDHELKSLRNLLIGQEINFLKDLRAYLADPGRQAQATSDILAEALLLRIKKDDSLNTVLQPTVEHIFHSSVRRSPKELVDSLFPVIGPAIRRSITESIKNLGNSLNFSLKSIKWFIEAKKTGQDFSTVVLLHTLDYQVEQILLIHMESGLKLMHVVAEGVDDVKDADQVSAMLAAIQNFVNDSFAEGGLNKLEFGERTIYVERAPQAYLACVVRGEGVPPNMSVNLRSALELIVMDCLDEFDKFNVNTNDGIIFQKARYLVEPLLTSHYKEESRKLPFFIKLIPAVMLLALLGGIGYFGQLYYKQGQLKERIIQQLHQPGIMTLKIEDHFFAPWELTVLKDDLAKNPQPLIIEAGLPPEKFSLRTVAYISQDYEIIKLKLIKILGNLPKGINIKLNSDYVLEVSGQASLDWALSVYSKALEVPGVKGVDLSGVVEKKEPEKPGGTPTDVAAYIDNQNILHLEGTAPTSWILNVREKAAATPGIASIEAHKVVDPKLDALKELANQINGVVIFFPVDADYPLPSDEAKLKTAIENLSVLEKMAEDMDLSVSLTIYGHADATGKSKYNYELSQSRAKTLAAMLYAKGSRMPIATYGMGADFASTSMNSGLNASADQASRKIELQVHINRKGTSLDLG